MRRSAKETKAILARADHLRALFAEFGATLSAFDPGATAHLPNAGRGEGWMGATLDFNASELHWLEPLLIELWTARRQQRRKR